MIKLKGWPMKRKPIISKFYDVSTLAHEIEIGIEDLRKTKNCTWVDDLKSHKNTLMALGETRDGYDLFNLSNQFQAVVIAESTPAQVKELYHSFQGTINDICTVNEIWMSPPPNETGWEFNVVHQEAVAVDNKSGDVKNGISKVLNYSFIGFDVPSNTTKDKDVYQFGKVTVFSPPNNTPS